MVSPIDSNFPKIRDLVIYSVQADRRALEQASAEAGASLTWKEKHEVVKATAITPPEVKNVPVEDEIPPKGAVDVSTKAIATQVNQSVSFMRIKR